MHTSKTALAEGGEVRAYKRRWLMLGLYSLALLVNAVPWMQYNVLTDVVTQFYDVGHELVEWTALVYNLTAIFVMVPSAWFLDKYGLRPAMLFGAAGTALGFGLRVLGSWPAHFWAILVGDAIVSVSSNLLLSARTRLAAVWFPANQVSSAVAATVIGSMFGVAIGCALAPLAARAIWTPEENFNGFLVLNGSQAAVSTLLMVATIIWFEEAPPKPPSAAQAAASAVATSGDFFKSVLRISSDGAFLMLLLAYNINGAVFSAIYTVLNRDIVAFYPEHAAEAGFMATLLCLSGMAGTFVLGVLLDKTRRLKELSVYCFLGSVLSMIAYSVVIATTSIEILYVVAALMGVFMTGYFVPGYEWAVELTYPEPEGNPSAILNWSFQLVGIVVTLAYSRAFSAWGAHVAHGILVALMATGFVAQLAMPKRYLRQQAELDAAKAGATGEGNRQATPGEEHGLKLPSIA